VGGRRGGVPDAVGDSRTFDINAAYTPTDTTELCLLMRKYGSDKGLGWHNYTTLYHAVFGSRRHDRLNVFELGLGSNHPDAPYGMGPDGKPGASLYAWRDYFPGAEVYGADIDRRVLFQTDRIKTFYCDQTSPRAIGQMWGRISSEMDVIVEDGLHVATANICFFERSIHKLARGGVYVIEDLNAETVRTVERAVARWRTRWPALTFRRVDLPNPLNHFDNRVLLVYKR
jgi:hypothetical protein